VQTFTRAILLLAIAASAIVSTLANGATPPPFEWQLDWHEVLFSHGAQVPRFGTFLGRGEPSHTLQLCNHWGTDPVFATRANNIGFRAEYLIYLSYPQTVSGTIRADDSFRLRVGPYDPRFAATPDADDEDRPWDSERWFVPPSEEVDDLFTFSKQVGAGWHLIELEYAEAGGEAYIEFDMYIPEYAPLRVWEHTLEMGAIAEGLTAEIRALEGQLDLLEAEAARLESHLMRLSDKAQSWKLTEH